MWSLKDNWTYVYNIKVQWFFFQWWFSLTGSSRRIPILLCHSRRSDEKNFQKARILQIWQAKVTDSSKCFPPGSPERTIRPSPGPQNEGDPENTDLPNWTREPYSIVKNDYLWSWHMPFINRRSLTSDLKHPMGSIRVSFMTCTTFFIMW